MKRLKALGLACVVALVVACVAYTATNSIVGVPNIGMGSASVNGYMVTNVAFNQDGSDPSLIDSVTFDVETATATTTGQVQLSPAGPWYSCSLGAPSAGVAHATCATTSPQLHTINVNQFAASLHD